MLLIFLAATILCALAQHDPDHLANSHALINQFRHMFEHVIDLNKDGVTTVNEELQYFHSHDSNGDCKWDYAEMTASREAMHGDHGPIHMTAEQIRAAFVWYDTRGCTQAADGFFVCDDIPFFFNMLDTNSDGNINSHEFEEGMLHLGPTMAALIPGGCPAHAP